jgi:LysR family glycine cleavage system transcriptional activator
MAKFSAKPSGKVKADGEMMKYRLPPLNALRAFEAAARHRNISHAAKELSVSPGAISRHVAALEQYLGHRLLNRQHRGVIPTEAGARYMSELTDAFHLIDAATRQVARATKPAALRVRFFTTLMSDWLSPRLGTFRTANPDINLYLSASLRPPDFEAEDLDLGMLVGPADWPDLHHDILFKLSFTPVCAPALMNGPHPLRTPEDLRHHALLYSPMIIPHWNEWLSRAGMEGIDTSIGLQFDSSGHSHQAARLGAGVALGQTYFLLDDLKSGRLVAPFGLSVEVPGDYCLVCPRSRKDEPSIAVFRRWIIDEAQRTVEEAARILESKLEL